MTYEEEVYDDEDKRVYRCEDCEEIKVFYHNRGDVIEGATDCCGADLVWWGEFKGDHDIPDEVPN